MEGHELGQPFERMLDWPEWTGDAIRTAVHGTATWLGFYVGVHEKGVLSAIGYGFGALNGVGTLLDIVSILEQVFGARTSSS